MTNLNNTPMTALEKVYREKVRKYEPLRRQCEEIFQRRCTLTTVIVSSLGVVYKESMKEIKSLLNLRPRALNILIRRISTAALIGSYLLFYKIPMRSPEYIRSHKFRSRTR
jgi:hypothetical protein